MVKKPQVANISKLTLAGLIITLGIVYGDIGTSPLYVVRAILAGSTGPVDRDFILGALSCIIWTLTLQTTIKYIIVTLRADNKGEGGIFALYALIRKKRRWVFIIAIIGGAALLADGVITPSITVVSAIEGLNMVNPALPVVPIALVIIIFLFIIQRFGTPFIGKSFGPIMLVWFTMLGVVGFNEIFYFPDILKSFNPYYAIKLLSAYPGGFLLLGAVFLCTTGAEALYSDLGHCGFINIRVSWIFVKTSLILNYLGQGAWVLSHPSDIASGTNPFFSMLPGWFLVPGIFIATAAAIIASQAMISGSYSIVSEAISLNFWPKMKIIYPAHSKGQMYIPTVNWALFLAVCFVILYFRESRNMEAAYGLAITITMLMTTALMTFYLINKRKPAPLIAIFVMVYLTIEGVFLIANLHKFTYGGWFTLLLAGLLVFVMFVWYRGREIKKRFLLFVKIADYADTLKDLKKDESIPKYAINLVYLTKADLKTDVESKIMFSIINRQPKRADRYWFLHLHIVDEPLTMEYRVETLIPDVLIRVDFIIGFKIQPRLNLFFKEVIDDLLKNKEIDITGNYDSLQKHHIPGDFRFVLIDRIQNYDFEFPPFDQFIMDFYRIINNIGISDIRAFGLDTSNIVIEQVPLESDVILDKFKKIYNLKKLDHH